MFRVNAHYRQNTTVEVADSISAALTWVEEFQYLGATEISVNDHLRAYELAELASMVRDLRD